MDTLARARCGLTSRRQLRRCTAVVRAAPPSGQQALDPYKADHESHAAVNLQFAEDFLQMHPNSVEAESELECDLLGCESVAHEPRDLKLAWAEPEISLERAPLPLREQP